MAIVSFFEKVSKKVSKKANEKLLFADKIYEKEYLQGGEDYENRCI